jgi:hypothetical protein
MPFVATNIDYTQLKFKEKIAEGNFAIVHRAIWKGTEVAVKASSLQLSLSSFTLTFLSFRNSNQREVTPKKTTKR